MNDPANVYHPSESDNYQVDPTNLTADQQKDLSVWVASIINPIREQLGNPVMYVNQSAIDFANDVAKGYNQDNWNISKGHDVSAIEHAASDFGLLDNYGNLYEDNGNNIPTTKCSMNDLKAAVYYRLKRFLFGDLSHADSVIGYGYDTPSYFGLAFDNHGDLLFEQIYKKYIQDPSKFNTNDNYSVPTTDINQLHQQQSQLQSQINALKDTISNDQKAVDQAINALNDAKNQANTNSTDKKKLLAEANNELQQAQTKLANDQKALANTQAALTNAQNALNSAKNKQSQDEKT